MAEKIITSGKRKTSIAKATIFSGSGNIKINNKEKKVITVKYILM